ncbi:MAG: hypothetical protein ACRCWJ_18985 [Casimicrobium sp.]
MKIRPLHLTLVFVAVCFGLTFAYDYFPSWLQPGDVAAIALFVLILLQALWLKLPIRTAVLYGLVFWIVEIALSITARFPLRNVDSLLAGTITVLILVVTALAVWAIVTVLAILLLKFVRHRYSKRGRPG